MASPSNPMLDTPVELNSGIRLTPADGQVVCPGCSAKSPRASRFCGSCGDRLWDPCIQCEELNSVAEKFCCSCGGDLHSSLKDARQEIEAKLAEAETMAEFGRFVDAIKLLQAIRSVDHSGLHGLNRDISGKVSEFNERRDDVVKNASSILESVKQSIEKSKLADALAEAKRVPPALRNGELARLHDETAAKLKRAERLREQIKQGIAEKQYDGLSAVASQYATLDPHDPWGAKVVDQLGRWQAKADTRRAVSCLKSASEALAKNAYRKAEALIAQTPSVEDPAITKVLLVAKERVWLANFVASSPYCTANEVAAAKRLLKLQPGDETAKKLASQLMHHCKGALATGQDARAPWVKESAECPLGIRPQLCELPEFIRRACRDANQPPHEFTIAYGLALAAVGAASISVNLMPAERGGWRSKLRFGGGKRAPQSAWGVDLGGGAVNAVCLAATSGATQPYVVQHIERIAYEQSELVASQKREEGLADAVVHALQELVAKHDLHGQRVAFSLSGPQTLGRFFELPAPSPAKFQQAVEFEVKQRVPLPAEDIVFDYHSEPLMTGEGDAVEKRWVTLVAVSRRQIAARVAPLSDLGCEALVMSSPVALLNAALGPGGALSDRSPDEGGAALVDVGGSSASIVVSTSNMTWFRGIHFGADTMAAGVAKSLNTDRQTARNLMRQPGGAPVMHRVHEALLPAFEELTGQLHRSLELCRADTGIHVNRILVTGSEANTFGLMRFLRSGR